MNRPRQSLVAAVAAVLLCALPAAGRADERTVQALAQTLRGYYLVAGGDTEGATSALRDAVAADPDSVELRISLAQLVASRKPGEALSVVDEGLARQPREPKLLILRARLLEFLTRREEAATAWQEAAKNGGGEEAAGGAVRTLETLGRLKEAEASARAWREASPKSAEAAFALGHVLYRAGDKAGARKALEEATELAPNDFAALRTLAAVVEDQGNDEAAATLYRKVITLNPHDAEARIRLVQVLARLGRPEEALKVLQEAQKWSASDPSMPLRLGMLLLQADRPAEAEAALRPYVEGHPADGRALYLLGVSLLVQEKLDAALAVFERVPPEADEYPDALARRAAALEALKRRPEAVKLLEDWLASHPGNEGMTLALAELKDEQGDVQGAIDLLETYVRTSSARSARVFFSLGALWDKLKDWQKSAEYMRKSLELNPDDAQTLNYLGYTYAEQGVNLEEAQKLIERALELKPDDGAVTDSLGWVYFKQGRYAEAEAVLKKAAGLMPKDAIIWEHLGDAARAAGDTDGAREAYKKAVELAPESDSAAKKLKALP